MIEFQFLLNLNNISSIQFLFYDLNTWWLNCGSIYPSMISVYYDLDFWIKYLLCARLSIIKIERELLWSLFVQVNYFLKLLLLWKELRFNRVKDNLNLNVFKYFSLQKANIFLCEYKKILRYFTVGSILILKFGIWKRINETDYSGNPLIIST